MIPLEALRGVRTILAHAYPDGPCADGLAAAMICKDVLPDADVVLLAHETVAYEKLAPTPGMLFVDITPPPETAGAFREAGAIVLDHHDDKEDLIASFGDRGVFAHSKRQPGVSGALLAFWEVWLPLQTELDAVRAAMEMTPLPDMVPPGHIHRFLPDMVPPGHIHRFAVLAGIRDTWQKQDLRWMEACEQAAVLLFYNPSEWLDDRPLDGARLHRRLAFGRDLVARYRRETAALVEHAYRFKTSWGARVVVLPSARISDAVELLPETDIVVGFSYHSLDAPSLKLSFRSPKREDGVDVSRIARTLKGGGGHRHSAGASLRLDLGFTSADLNPYNEIKTLLETTAVTRALGVGA